MPAFIASVVSPKTGGTSAPLPNTITLAVLNGGGVNGAASSASHALAAVGFHTGTPATAPNQAKTTVEYPATDAAAAKVVAGYFPGAALAKNSSISEIEVVLGTDHIAVNPEAGAAANPPTPKPTAAPTKTYDSQSCVQ
jgi:hypothetical protein